MRFVLSKTSDILCRERPHTQAKKIEGRNIWTIDFDTLEELINFIEEVGGSAVIEKDGGEWELEIYDSYRE